MEKRKLISIVLPTFNEEENVKEIFAAILKEISEFKNYDFEVLFIDNSSEDRTVELIKEIIKYHTNVRCIVNTRNFGHIRSPHYALTQSDGDAVILLASDFQDPPEMIPEFIKKWEEGNKIVMGVRNKTEEGIIIGLCRRIFYYLVTNLSEVNLVKNFTRNERKAPTSKVGDISELKRPQCQTAQGRIESLTRHAKRR